MFVVGLGEKAGTKLMVGVETGRVEGRKGGWKSLWGGEMGRDREEHRWRKRLSGM